MCHGAAYRSEWLAGFVRNAADASSEVMVS